jgi:hypothetical protein
MTLKTETKLLEICDLFASGFTYSDCARISGVAPRTLFMWLRNSTAGIDPDLIINYMEEPMQFAQAMALARKVLHMQVRSALETRSALGHAEPIFFQGRPSWVEDERCVGLDEDTRDMLGYPRDGLLRDENGNRVQHTLWHQPPIAAALRVLEMSFSEEYTPTQNINTINSDTGVKNATPVTGEKIEVPPKPTRPVIEDKSSPVPSPSPTGGPVEDADYQDLLGPQPVGSEPEAKPATDTDPAAPVVTPGIQPDDRVVEPVMIRTATPPEYSSQPNPLLSPRTGRQRSALEMSLLAELDKTLAKKGTQA